MSWSTERTRLLGLCSITLGVLIAAGMAWASSRGDDKKDLPVMVEEARRRAEQTSIKVTPGKFSDQKRVEAAAATARARGEEELRRRADAVRRESEAHSEAQAPDGTPAKSIQKNRPMVQGRVVVALSSSMPETMLRDYMRQLHEVPEGIAVLRGFVGGARTVTPTGKWVERVRRTQAQCLECAHYQVEVVVDPLIYRMLDIQKVPAVAYLHGVQDLRHCDAQVLETATVVYGAASISSALKRLKRDGVPVPGEILTKFGGG